MAATRPVSDALTARVRSGGGGALVTHYELATGARTELSVATFANWADKTANLLDDLGLDAEASVALPVLVEAPAHWMALVWPFALWQRGLAARVVPRAEAADADLTVIGPDAPTPVGAETLACSLDPWGRPLPDLPSGVADFAGEALAQPDAHAAVRPNPDAPAWTDGVRSLTFADLAGLDPIADRVLTSPADAWASVSLLVRAVVGGGSVVLVAGEGDLARLAASERAVWHPVP